MNLPTKLTVLRLILSLVIVGLLCFPFHAFGLTFPVFDFYGVQVELQYIIAGVIFIVASLTDWLDGYIARKYNMVTDTGKMLDAIADKALVNTVLIILAAQGFVHVIVPVVIVLRDIVVNAIKMEAAIGSGKLKTASLMVGTTLAFFYNIPFVFLHVSVDQFLLYFACIMSIISAVQYFNMNKDIIFPSKAK